MLPNRDTPVPDTLLHAGLWVADAVYSPLWTPLLTAAQGQGRRVMTGRELAIYQAADAFELFTGPVPSADRAWESAFDAVMAQTIRLPIARGVTNAAGHKAADQQSQQPEGGDE